MQGKKVVKVIFLRNSTEKNAEIFSFLFIANLGAAFQCTVRSSVGQSEYKLKNSYRVQHRLSRRGRKDPLSVFLPHSVAIVHPSTGGFRLYPINILHQTFLDILCLPDLTNQSGPNQLFV